MNRPPVNVRYIGHLDTLQASAGFAKLRPHSWNPAIDCEEMRYEQTPHKAMLLRVHNGFSFENWLEDEPCHDRPVLAKWGSMRKLLDLARRRILADPVMRDFIDPTAPLGRVVVSVIDKGGHIQLHTDLGEYAGKHARFHIPLATNPKAVVWAANETVHLPVGMLTYVNTQVIHGAGNFGETWRSHVLFEMRLRGADEGDA